MRLARRLIFPIVLAAYGAALLLAGTGRTQSMPPPDNITAGADAGLVARGAYLAKMGDCTTCHTNEKGGGRKFAGGLPIRSPFGKIYSTNITPDPEYGIGDYTLADFTRALRRGVAKDGHHLYPAMPYPSFAKASDEDIRALYAFFMHGVEPVASQPPRTRLPFPVNQRWGLWIWNRLFLRTQRYKPEPGRGDAWNRGAYIVQGLGHCGACHTPRTIFYNEKSYDAMGEDFLTGQTLDRWYAPNLRGDLASGLGRWEEADIVSFLKTGHGHGAAAFGNMKGVVEKSMQYMTEDDLQAIALYLKSLAPYGDRAVYEMRGEGARAARAAYPQERPGAGIYAQYCARCHGGNGRGRPPSAPHLAGSSVLMSRDPTSLIRLLLAGGAAPRTESGPPVSRMPAFARQLNDAQIADVLSYIRSAWGNGAGPVTARQVRLLREDLRRQGAESPAQPHAAQQDKNADDAHHRGGHPQD
jgi:mono/diheme cytochrome c family protein